MTTTDPIEDREAAYGQIPITTAHRGIERGEVDADAEFPDVAARLTAADVIDATVAPVAPAAVPPAPKG